MPSLHSNTVAFVSPAGEFLFKIELFEEQRQPDDFISKKIQAALVGSKDVGNVLFSPDGKQAICIEFGNIRVWNLSA